MADNYLQYNYEGLIEGAVKYIFTHNGIPCYQTRESASLETPRVMVELVCQGARDHFYQTGSMFLLDSFRGSLNVVVVSDRSNNHASHSIYVAKARYLLRSREIFHTGSFLSYLHIDSIAEGQCNNSLMADENEDATGITYQLVWSIKPDAWTA